MADAGRRLCRHHSGLCARKLLERYRTAMEQVFGQGSCYVLRCGNRGSAGDLKTKKAVHSRSSRTHGFL